MPLPNRRNLIGRLLIGGGLVLGVWLALLLLSSARRQPPHPHAHPNANGHCRPGQQATFHRKRRGGGVRSLYRVRILASVSGNRSR